MFALFVAPTARVEAAPPPQRPFRLCILDQGSLLQRAQVALNEAARFQQLRGQAQARLDDDRRTLDADDRALAALQASIPLSAYNARKAQLDARRRDLVDRTAALNDKLGKLDAELTNIAMKAATPFIVQVENDHGCSLLAARSGFLAINDPSLDITGEVIERMNAAASVAPQR